MKLSSSLSILLCAVGLNGDRFAYGAVSQADLDEAALCNQNRGTLVFLLLENEAVNAAVEDDIRRDLAKIGFNVEAKLLSKVDINDARQSGDFHFSISETWGTPYDPHSFASGWIDGLGGEGIFPAMQNFNPPDTREELFDLISDVLQEDDIQTQSTKWESIHNYYHRQAVMLPMWGKRIPTLLNSRLTGYEAGFQQFDYPVHRLVPLTGSDTVKIAPGARTGMFKTVGYLDAHTYGPNEFFSNNWIYEGLVSYGQGGQILPSLATSWQVNENDIGGDTYAFTLRENVLFHDGMPWNCDAAKLNFDHLLAGALVNRHGWYGVPLVTEDWYCEDDFTFVIRTNTKHGPYLQELTLIRPIRMISPGSFPANGTNPLNANSCQLDWGTVEGDEFVEDVICAGITGPYGTGPFVFDSRDTRTVGDEEIDTKVVFVANENYWGGVPAVKRLEVIYYDTSDEVKADLLNGNLDVVWGSGVLPDEDIKEIRDSPEYQESIRVFHSGPLQNVILILNSGVPPFDDINVRKTVIHAINKAAIVNKELHGLQQVVDNIFPLEAPFCDVDLTPRWDYDIEKAVLLSCLDYVAPTPPPQTDTNSNNVPIVNGASEVQEKDNSLVIGLGVGLGIAFVLMAVVAVSCYNKNKDLEQQLEVQEGATQA